jgi:DNA-directed RNA polymerase beta subunit
LPTGINAVVAIMPFKYNQEDSIIMNRYSIDRGFMRCTQLKTLKDTLKPDETYADFPLVNREVKKGDVLLEKTRSGYRKVGGKRVPFEQSVPVVASHSGVVDKVFVYKERNGADACKVRVRKQRIPTVGDKFASRSAQKGKFVLRSILLINPVLTFFFIFACRHHRNDLQRRGFTVHSGWDNP